MKFLGRTLFLEGPGGKQKKHVCIGMWRTMLEQVRLWTMFKLINVGSHLWCKRVIVAGNGPSTHHKEALSTWALRCCATKPSQNRRWYFSLSFSTSKLTTLRCHQTWLAGTCSISFHGFSLFSLETCYIYFGDFPATPHVATRPELTAEEVQLAKGAFAMLKLSLPDVCGFPSHPDNLIKTMDKEHIP